MSFGIYVHIPYCIQRCTYCDFATYEQFKILPPDQYVELLFEEIRQKKNYFAARQFQFSRKNIDTLYFGGGTPSLIPAELIVAIIHELAKHGFTTGPESEVTLEINPATVSEKKLETYLNAGVNRFSVGAQTFDDRLLKMVHREHSAQQTLETLALLRKHKLNFSFDILFALPSQTLEGLQRDVDIALEQGATHISPYCLTVPEAHPLSKGRPLEEDQVGMFEVIAEKLMANGFHQYEISNFSLPGFESRHNILYWADEEYWGLGLSAHSYGKTFGKAAPWGVRFWNHANITEYEKQIRDCAGKTFNRPEGHLPGGQLETLLKNQSLTDFCHTSLRRSVGLSDLQLEQKFSAETAQRVRKILQRLTTHNWVSLNDKGHWCLTNEGLLISNQIFAQLTFLDGEI
jgi:oxygen-independent coproporphyrinogen-3 oxidase